MIDTIRLKEIVRSNIRQLAEALYPNGKFHHGEWRVGNVAGDPGDSLGIRLMPRPEPRLWPTALPGRKLLLQAMAMFGCKLGDKARVRVE